MRFNLDITHHLGVNLWDLAARQGHNLHGTIEQIEFVSLTHNGEPVNVKAADTSAADVKDWKTNMQLDYVEKDGSALFTVCNLQTGLMRIVLNNHLEKETLQLAIEVTFGEIAPVVKETVGE
jgi:hypothetical protein